MRQHSIAVIGLGKISQDQHLPVIDGNSRFRLCGVVSQRGLTEKGIPTFKTARELFSAVPEIEAVSICTPPAARHAIAREALAAGKHVLLEKPPTPTVSEFRDLGREAAERRLVIFQTWHSQYNAAVEETRRRLQGQRIASLFVEWKEDVRRWHPGQEWIWAPGGFGVLDPGINALSIVTRIMPAPIFVSAARLDVPANRQTPIAGSLTFKSPAAASATSRLTAELDWRQTGEQTWTIAITTQAGSTLLLERGGSVLSVDGERIVEAPLTEYEQIYDRFAGLLDSGVSDMDEAPLMLVADAYMLARRSETDRFDW